MSTKREKGNLMYRLITRGLEAEKAEKVGRSAGYCVYHAHMRPLTAGSWKSGDIDSPVIEQGRAELNPLDLGDGTIIWLGQCECGKIFYRWEER